MICGFWDTLKRPFFAQAPMADVTDAAFRELITDYGKPDVFFTEFVSADGLCSPGKSNILIDLEYSQWEHPIVAQIFSSKPECVKSAARFCKSLGFDGVDINMGCPDRSIEKQGAGAALIKNYSLARELISAAKEGVGELPVSVKTRAGYSKNELETWLPALLSAKPAAITIHLRTRGEMSKVPAHWEWAKEASKIAENSGVFIIGNGDVVDLEDAKEKAIKSGVDGVMLGRAIFGNPWLYAEKTIPSLADKLAAMVNHAELFDKHFKGKKNFAIMRKHYKAYVCGFAGAKELRAKLMRTESSSEVREVIDTWKCATSNAAHFLG